MDTEKIVDLAMRAGFLDDDDIRINIQYTCVAADLKRLADLIEAEVVKKFVDPSEALLRFADERAKLR